MRAIALLAGQSAGRPWLKRTWALGTTARRCQPPGAAGYSRRQQVLSCSASVELQHACHRKGLQLGPSHVELHEIAEAAELLLKRTAEEKYGNLSSSC